MSRKSTPEQRIERLRSFVISTREIIEQNDFSNINIRKIAERAGFHNSTLYSYFKDAEYLLSLASVKYFDQYSYSLAELNHKRLSEQENFYELWYFFCSNAFKLPEIYSNFFFGKHSNDLNTIFEEYYIIFPDEYSKQAESLHNTYIGKNINTICMNTLKPLLKINSTRLTNDNIIIANNLIISYFKTLLEQALENKKHRLEVNITDLTEEFMTSLNFIVYK